MSPHRSRPARRPASLLAALTVGLVAVLLLSGCTANTSTPTSSAAAPVASLAALPGLTVVGAAPTTASPGEEFAPVNVVLTHTAGAIAPNAVVTYTVASGDAAFADGLFTTSTDASGVATAYGLVAGTTSGEVHLTVASGASTLDVALSVD